MFVSRSFLLLFNPKTPVIYHFPSSYGNGKSFWCFLIWNCSPSSILFSLWYFILEFQAADTGVSFSWNWNCNWLPISRYPFDVVDEFVELHLLIHICNHFSSEVFAYELCPFGTFMMTITDSGLSYHIWEYKYFLSQILIFILTYLKFPIGLPIVLPIK